MAVCPKCNTVYGEDANFCRIDGVPLLPLASETHLAVGSVVNESLRVVERMRTDRFGVVYRVDDEIHPGRAYALRLFVRGLVNSRVYGALSDLASRLAGELDEPEILGGYIPIQLEDGRYAMLADDYPGSILDEVIQREAPFTPELVVSTLLRIAEILVPAHRAGLVHGTLTPESILVADRSERGLAIKLLDFGLVATIRQHNARALATLSSAPSLKIYDNYYAPELVAGRGAQPDEKTEIYSLGALCYHMLSGWVPFTEAAIEGDAAVYLTEDPRPLVMLNQELGIPRDLEATMLQAMALDPGARHASLGELIERLQEIELDFSISPPTTAPRAGDRPPPGASRRRSTDPITGGRETAQPDGDTSQPDEEPDVPITPGA
jgi:serine/threonine-protein kinase